MKNYLIFARFLVLSILLGTSFGGSAQHSADAQIIRLKAGGSFLGKVINHDDNGYQVVLVSGDTIVLSDQSVAAVIEQKKAYHFFPDGKFTPTKGKYFSFLINTYYGYNENDFWNPFEFDISPLNFSAGYRFNQQLEVGAGTGFDIYSSYGLFVPLFAELRYYLNKKPTSLFVGGKLGGAFLVNPNGFWFNENSSGGLLVNPVIGLKSASRRKAKFILEAGIKIQKASFVGWNQVDDITMFRYSLGAGWLF